AEAAQVLASYGITTVIGDRYAGGFPPEHFATHGIAYIPSEQDRSAIYLDLLPLVNARIAHLLDHPDLLRELRGLERHRRASGRDRVDHRAGSHDDLANAAAGAFVLAQRLSRMIANEMTDDELASLRAWGRQFGFEIPDPNIVTAADDEDNYPVFR